MYRVHKNRERLPNGYNRAGRLARRALILLIASGLLAADQAMTATVAPTRFEFGPPQTLSDVEAAGSRVVIDSHDRATVVWQAISPDHESLLIQAVRLDAEGVPGSIQTLSSVPNFGNPKGCRCPQAAVDPQDRVTVAWQTFDGANLRIQAARLGPDGVPDPVQTLSGAGQDAWAHQLAVDSQGRATVVWHVISESTGMVESVRLQPDGTVELRQTLSEAGVDAVRPAVAIDLLGRATVVWNSGGGVQAIRLAADGTPGPIQTVSPPGEDAGAAQVAIDSQGRATVAWWRGAGVYEVKAVRLDSDGTPGAVRTLSPEGQAALNPGMAVDPLDRVTVTWEDFGQHVNAVRLGADGAPGPVYRLSRPDRVAGNPRVASGPEGEAVVVWSHPPPVFIPPFDKCLDEGFEPESDFVRAALIGPDGVPGPPLAVSPRGEQSGGALVAIDSQGRPTVAWTSFDGTYFCPDVDTRVQSSRGVEVLQAPAGPPAAEPPDPLLPGAAPPRGSDGTLRLGGRALARGGRVAIRAACGGARGEVCKGVIWLLAHTRPGKARARQAGKMPRKTPRRVLVAKGCYRLAAGRRGVLRLRLSRLGRRLVYRAAPRPVRTLARGRGIEARAVSVVAPSRFAKRGRQPRTRRAALFDGYPASGSRHRCRL